MSDFQSLETITVKRDRWKYFLDQIAIWLGLILLELLPLAMLKHNMDKNIAIPILFWIICSVIPLILLYMGVFLIPGQGDILLTEKGFRINYFFNFWPAYFWQNIKGFYTQPDTTTKNAPDRVLCDLHSLVYRSRVKVLPRFYEFSSEELASLLNQWKKQHAPDLSSIDIKPIVQPQTTVKPNIDTFRIKLSIYLVSAWNLYCFL